MARLGKRIVDDLYVHLSALHAPDIAEHRSAIEHAVRLLPSDVSPPCVAKLNVRTGRLALLNYPLFEQEPFPALAQSWSINLTSGAAVLRDYSSSLNPPILHRKELLVEEAHPLRERWTRLTQVAESLGLFDEASTIGFKLNWERAVAGKGYRLVGDEFLPIGNEMGAAPQGEVRFDGKIQRHLTALTRYDLSAPIQLLLRHGLLSTDTSLFDYGCGRGGDVATLSANGIAAQGWDPYFAAALPLVEADVVNLGFVVNVIEDPAERVEAIQKSFALARRVLAVSVMLYGGDQAARPFQDGVVTSRGTFQKYFSQGEFKDYLEHVLHREAFMVGPGVAFIFPDSDCEQRFNAGRYRRRGMSTQLAATRARIAQATRSPKLPRARPNALRPEPKPSNDERALAEHRALLDVLWAQALDLGRFPDALEVENGAEVERNLGGLVRAVRLLGRHYDQALLAACAKVRRDDLQLYMAAQQFSRRPSYRHLERRLQGDIKSFFGDYRTAQAAGVELLLKAARPDELLQACQQASTEGMGWLDGDHSLQFHIDIIDRLPVVLRAYVACGLILWDAISEVQLIKIHIGSGKLTLLEYENFQESPVPLLRRRIKVNIRKQDYELFEYGSSAYPSPFLYRKSRFMHEDSVGYAQQLAFDEALEAGGVLNDSETEPPSEKFVELLELARLQIDGMQLVPSQQIPDLDQSCGAHLSFRSFIECGETQQRLKLSNRPLNPATYNALHALAIQILDPIIEYFGAIRLTYGFCSAELGRHISHRVAPKLDQHAGCELNTRKAYICDRLGASCDFMVDDEDMREVADWIIDNLPFDRLYFYGADRPIHVSFGPQQSRAAYEMKPTADGATVPRPYKSAKGA